MYAGTGCEAGVREDGKEVGVTGGSLGRRIQESAEPKPRLLRAALRQMAAAPQIQDRGSLPFLYVMICLPVLVKENQRHDHGKQFGNRYGEPYAGYAP